MKVAGKLPLLFDPGSIDPLSPHYGPMWSHCGVLPCGRQTDTNERTVVVEKPGPAGFYVPGPRYGFKLRWKLFNDDACQIPVETETTETVTSTSISTVSLIVL